LKSLKFAKNCVFLCSSTSKEQIGVILNQANMCTFSNQASKNSHIAETSKTEWRKLCCGILIDIHWTPKALFYVTIFLVLFNYGGCTFKVHCRLSSTRWQRTNVLTAGNHLNAKKMQTQCLRWTANNAKRNTHMVFYAKCSIHYTRTHTHTPPHPHAHTHTPTPTQRPTLTHHNIHTACFPPTLSISKHKCSSPISHT